MRAIRRWVLALGCVALVNLGGSSCSRQVRGEHEANTGVADVDGESSPAVGPLDDTIGNHSIDGDGDSDATVSLDNTPGPTDTDPPGQQPDSAACSCAPVAELVTNGESASGSWSFSPCFRPLVECTLTTVDGIVYPDACSKEVPFEVGAALSVVDSEGEVTTTANARVFKGLVVEPAVDVDVRFSKIGEPFPAMAATAKLRAVVRTGMLPTPYNATYLDAGATEVTASSPFGWGSAKETKGLPLPAPAVQVGDAAPSFSPGHWAISRGSNDLRRWVTLVADDVKVDTGAAFSIDGEGWFLYGPAMFTVDGPASGDVLVGIVGIGPCRGATTMLTCARSPDTGEMRWQYGAPLPDEVCWL